MSPRDGDELSRGAADHERDELRCLVSVQALAARPRRLVGEELGAAVRRAVHDAQTARALEAGRRRLIEIRAARAAAAAEPPAPAPSVESVNAHKRVVSVERPPAEAAAEPNGHAAAAEPTAPPTAAAEPEHDAPSGAPAAAATNGHAEPLLSAEHIAHLRTSGLNDETIALAELYTERDPRKLAKIIGRTYWTKWGNAIVFPFYLPGATEPHAYRIRPDNPRVERRDNGKDRAVKYDQRAKKQGGTQLVYFPPRARAGGWYADATRTQYWIEGEKKALALDQLGYTSVGLTGAPNYLDPARDKGGLDVLDPQITRHVVIADRDHVIVLDRDYTTNPNTRKAMRRLADLLYALGARSVSFAMSDFQEAKGGDDVLAQYGESALRAMLARTRLVRRTHASRSRMPAVEVPGAEQDRVGEQADPPEPPLRSVSAAVGGAAAQKAQQQQRAGAAITLEAGERYAVLKEVIDRLADSARVYQRSNKLVRPLPDALSATEQWTRHALDAEIERSMAFETIKHDENGCPFSVPSDAPRWLSQMVLEHKEWPRVRKLAAVVTSPIIDASGTVIAEPGYHAHAQVLYQAHSDVELVQVPEHPTLDEVALARAALKDLVHDFPFVEDAHGAGWVAYVATVVARFAFNGPTPLFWLDASTAGSGKGLLESIGSEIALWHPAYRSTWTPDDEGEQRKVITSLALRARRVALFDNVPRGAMLGGSVLSAVLTTSWWSDRILGGHSQYDGPWTTVLVVTGNNLELGEDMHRRVVHIRLEPKEERPEERESKSFRYPQLVEHVREHRVELLSAVLTILRAYVAHGRPAVELLPWLGYEEWSKAVRAPLVWADFADPALALKPMRESGATPDHVLARLLAHLAEVTCAQEFRSSELHEELYARGPIGGQYVQTSEAHKELRLAISEARDYVREPNPRQLGKLLSSLRKRVFCLEKGEGEEERTKKSYRLVVRLLSGNNLWKVEELEGGNPTKTDGGSGG